MISRNQVALNAIQWINLPQTDDDSKDEPVWLYNEPSWLADQPDVHRQIKDSGFDAVMMEVLAFQTLQSYERMIDGAGLALAPGYVQIGLPEDFGQTIRPGSKEWVRWMDPVRRRAEESNYFGLPTVFLSSDMAFPGRPRIEEAVAVGHAFDQGRLDRVVELIGGAAEVLKAEGVRPGLHNHIGSWIETEYEIDYVLDQVGADLLGASPDIGHLEWAGIDSPAFLRKHQNRLVDLHLKDLDLGIAAASRETPTSYYGTADQRFFLEPGLGQIDLPGVIDALGADFGGWIVIEVDRASMPPLESALFTAEWVRKTFPA
jgi:sugar phosphate isomerase/epimerase